ncbi:hypothetical protein AMS68_005608 [Peltaster fructicola]|uniref:Uncharacterized protein n=1 Tax=Peltaster fructicola TaxID=286661 RepID=A0A6H0XZJ5_9PEZI|nr:hypothetical protein AMS68_005608 [Peltaster fructicola]
MSSRRSAQSAKIPDLSRLTISSSNGAMPVTTRSMRRDQAQARGRQERPSRHVAQSRIVDSDGEDDSDQESSAVQEQKRELFATQAVSLHFAAMVPSAWFNAQIQDGTPQSDQLLRTIRTLGRHAAQDPDLLTELSSNRVVSVQDRSWTDSVLQMLFGQLEHIRTNFPPNDVPDTSKVLASWLNAVRNICVPLKLYHASRASAKDQLATIIVTAWEFVVRSDFDFSEVQRYQPTYTRPDPYGNNLFRSITEGRGHGTFGLGELNWALTGSDSRELAGRALVVCRYIYEKARRPANEDDDELMPAVQDIFQSTLHELVSHKSRLLASEPR